MAAVWLKRHCAAALTALALCPAWPVRCQPLAALSCAANHAFARAADRLELRAWASTADAQPAELPAPIRWRASAGQIDSTPTGSVWTLPAAGNGSAFEVDAVLEAGAKPETCRVSVIVKARERPTAGPSRGQTTGALLPARSTLVSGSDEPSGYGAYTYLLLASPPRQEERERHLAVLVAYLRQLNEHDELERYVPPERLNLWLLPLRYRPRLPPNLRAASDASLLSAAQDLLAAYDYARAQVVLARLGTTADASGPYLLMTMQPATLQAHTAVVTQNMSNVDPRVAEEWVRWQTRLAASPRAWSNESLTQLALSLRNMLATAARALPDAGVKAQQWVSLSQIR